MDSNLFLIRHGKSEWNELGLWTGWTDISLHPLGVLEARRAGEALKDFFIHSAHVSTLKRAQETLQEIQNTTGGKFPIRVSPALNERHYGIYTGKNKWQIKNEIGEKAFEEIRRGWNTPIPEGETLEVVHNRIVPYYTDIILPELRDGKNVLIVAHGNSLRALMKHIEDIPVDQIPFLEIACGEIVRYRMKGSTFVREKQ